MAEPKGTGRAQQPDDEPLLRLSTLDTVRPIEIDGERYDFVNLDALPIRRRQEIANLLVSTVQTILLTYREDTKPLTRKREKALQDDISTLVRWLLPKLPARVFDALSSTMREDIVVAFFSERSKRIGGALLREIAMPQTSERSTGASGSRGSNGSTAASRKRGTTASRRRSSRR